MTAHLTDDLIQDYFDEALDLPKRRAAERHLSECPRCAARLSGLESLREVLGALPKGATHVPLPGGFEPDRVAHGPSAPVPPSPRRRRRILAGAAGLAATFAIGLAVGAALLPRVEDSRLSSPDGGLEAMEVASEVQRTGTAYAAAVVALGSLRDAPESRFALSQGREAALSVLYAATLAYASLEPDDVPTGKIVEAIDAARRSSGSPSLPQTSGY
ncbi:MAG: zf-HC2 domain-containing protein [Gemmatimonadota bacterium]|nr:zf-HC2 domain-containing protein [Gemmatimonadota bacterium]